MVRIAIGLSALTGRAVSIDHVRGNRQGNKGLKSSHAAAVKLLAEISGSKISGGEVGSQSLSFSPQAPRSSSGPLVDLSQVTVKPEYKINLSTAGAITLIFQALYPYLLYVGSQALTPFVKVKISGGTNASHSPSYDYVSQVIVPNFAKLGLPALSVTLHKRGWSSGPIDLGAMTFLIHPLGSQGSPNKDSSSEDSQAAGNSVVDEGKFPKIDLMRHERGKITQIDLTVLAPNQPTWTFDDSRKPGTTLRDHIEQGIRQALRRKMRKMDASTFETSLNSPSDKTLNQDPDDRSPVPVEVHTSEATFHRSHIYILLVAHTSSGFRIGHDALGSLGKGGPKKQSHKGKQKRGSSKKDDDMSENAALFAGATEMVDQCVDGFIEEISKDPTVVSGKTGPSKKSFLDEHMRDQIVVFEALGEAFHGQNSEAAETTPREDEREWSLHTQTAQWVCQQVLGGESQ